MKDQRTLNYSNLVVFVYTLFKYEQYGPNIGIKYPLHIPLNLYPKRP